MNTLIRLILIISLIFLMMFPFIPWLLKLISTPDEFIEEGAMYFRLLMVATIINFINLVYINIEKTRGRTGIIMILNIMTMLIKLILSALFVYVRDLLSILSHIAVSLRIELLLTQDTRWCQYQ